MSGSTVAIAVHGAAGRMGRRVIAVAVDDPQISLIGGVESSLHPLLGKDIGVIAGISPLDIPLTSTFPAQADAVIDFSLPQAVAGCVDACVRQSTRLVVATTGLEAEHKQLLLEASKTIPICWAPACRWPST